MSEFYSDFEGFSDSTKEILVGLVFSVLGIFISIFHLIVLSRKSMRNNTINVIMIGIGLCDVLTMGFLSYFVLIYLITDDCTPASSYRQEMFDLILTFGMDITRRLVAWFGILMGSFRFLIIKHALNPSYSILSDPKFSIKAMAIMLLVSTVMSAYYFFRKPIIEIGIWQPPEECTGFPENYTRIDYETTADYWGTPDLSLGFRVFNLIDGVLRLIPTFAFPTFTFLLVRKLRQAENSRSRMMMSKQNEQKEHTVTKLVILMTFTFMLAEGPFGVVFFVQSIIVEPPGLVYISFDIADMLGLFKVLNASTHCLICLKIATQYRNTAKGLLGIKEKTVTVVAANSTTRSDV